jgi:outer membrane protein insertion porin family
MMLMKTVRRFKSATLAATLLAIALLGGGTALAQEIVVQGNGRVDTETVRSYVTGSGSLEEARRNMLQSGMFSDVRLSRQGSRIVVSVREAVTINRVVVEGNKKINRDALEADLQTKARRPFSQATVDADIARLRDIYTRIGRAAAKVSARRSTCRTGASTSCSPSRRVGRRASPRSTSLVTRRSHPRACAT